MEEEGGELQAESNPEPTRTRVGFPQATSEKKSPGKLIFIIILVLLVLGGGAWFLFGRGGSQPATDVITSTNFIQESTPIPTPTVESIERSGVKIQILNGTGITKAAASLQEKLQNLGYSEFKAGNASPQNYRAAEVTFDSNLPEAVKDEILSLLEDVYQDVETKSKSMDEFDVEITTGYPVGYTSSPTPKATPTSTPKPTSPATTGTPSPSPSPSPSPTPTP